MIGNRIEKQVEVTYAYQELKDIPEQYQDKFAGEKETMGNRTGNSFAAKRWLILRFW